MLKHGKHVGYGTKINPAAFRRLCVETRIQNLYNPHHLQPPSGGCVLKLKCIKRLHLSNAQPPSGGCVLKLLIERRFKNGKSSRLQAAVC